MPNQPQFNPPWFRGRAAPENLIRYQSGPTQYVPEAPPDSKQPPIRLPPGLVNSIKGLLPNKLSNALFARPTYANALADPSIYAHATPRPLSSGIGSIGTPGGLQRLSTFANPNALPAAYATPLPSAQSAFATPAFGGASLAAPASPLAASAPALATSVAPQAFGVAAASPLAVSGIGSAAPSTFGVAAAAPTASATAAPVAASLAPFLGPAALGGLFALKHPRREGRQIIEGNITFLGDRPMTPGSKNASPEQLEYFTNATKHFYDTFKDLNPQFNPFMRFEGTGREKPWRLNLGGTEWFSANTYPELLALAKKYMPDEVSNPLLSLGQKEQLAAYQKTGQFLPPKPVTRWNPLTGKPLKGSKWEQLSAAMANRQRRISPIVSARTQQNLRLLA